MDIPDFTDSDLARVTLSAQLRQVSESLRLAVATEDRAGGDGRQGLATELFTLLGTEVPRLREAIVGYARARGASWADIAAVSGLSEQDARARWGDTTGPHLDDPAAEAAALDAWYVMHAQLEPLARVRDPFTRLLSGREPEGTSCLVCAKYAGDPVPAWAGYPVPPGGHLIDNGMWRVGHGPTPYWPAGTLLIESYRHFVDYADFEPEEAATFGPMIKLLTGPLKEATGAPRVHLFACMEGTEHFHTWLVPRTGEHASGRTFIGNPGYSTPVEAEEVIGRVRKAMERAEATR
jgi:diadenosine tetraphosphate (Ap4A) HIT family hydrolase